MLRPDRVSALHSSPDNARSSMLRSGGAVGGGGEGGECGG